MTRHKATNKHTWVCPKCGHTQGTDIDPKYMQPPTHRNERVHHHNRPVTMELQE